jgi:hypothetical protein
MVKDQFSQRNSETMGLAKSRFRQGLIKRLAKGRDQKNEALMTQVQYLGYIIDEQGVHVDPTKIQVIRDWPAPTTLTELRNFLGLANFYHRFVLGFSHITWPLSQVTKGGAKKKFFGLKTQQKAFLS